MPPFIDLTGQRFGRLTVIEFAGRRPKGKKLATQWVCQCDCGNIKTVLSNCLRIGTTVSCGCYNSDVHATHRKVGTKAHNTWKVMLDRCRNPNTPNFKYYGARGISVCNRWLKFENFLDDMGQPPEGCTLDRIDSNGNYEPKNCRWANAKDQANNRTNNVVLMYEGKRWTFEDLAREFGKNIHTLRSRIQSGWAVERAVNTPTNNYTRRTK